MTHISDIIGLVKLDDLRFLPYHNKTFILIKSLIPYISAFFSIGLSTHWTFSSFDFNRAKKIVFFVRMQEMGFTHIQIIPTVIQTTTHVSEVSNTIRLLLFYKKPMAHIFYHYFSSTKTCPNNSVFEPALGNCISPDTAPSCKSEYSFNTNERLT